MGEFMNGSGVLLGFSGCFGYGLDISMDRHNARAVIHEVHCIFLIVYFKASHYVLVYYGTYHWCCPKF